MGTRRHPDDDADPGVAESARPSASSATPGPNDSDSVRGKEIRVRRQKTTTNYDRFVIVTGRKLRDKSVCVGGLRTALCKQPSGKTVLRFQVDRSVRERAAVHILGTERGRGSEMETVEAGG